MGTLNTKYAGRYNHTLDQHNPTTALKQLQNWEFNDFDGFSNQKNTAILGNFEAQFAAAVSSPSTKESRSSKRSGSLPVTPSTDVVVPTKSCLASTFDASSVDTVVDSVNDPTQSMSTQKAPINYNEPTQAQLDADQAKKEDILNQILLAGN